MALFTLDLDLLPPDPIDLLAEVTVDRILGSGALRQFTGVVVVARSVGDRLTVEAQSGTAFSEGVIPGLSQRGVPGFEIIHLLGRIVGLRDDQLNIQGMDTLPREVFEVVVAVTTCFVVFGGDRRLTRGSCVPLTCSLLTMGGQRQRPPRPIFMTGGHQLATAARRYGRRGR